MKYLIPLFVIALMLVVVGCSSPPPTNEIPPTPNIQATIEAGVRATRVAENDAKIATNVQKAIDATLTAPPPTSTLRPFDHNIDKYYNEGVHYTEQGWWKESIEKFDKAIELDPNFAMAYSNRGAIYAKWHQYQLAIENYNQAIILDPTYADPYFNKSLASEMLGQTELAQESMQKACELNRELC